MSPQGFLFGPWPIKASEIFYSSKHCFGLVNLKPVLPGHVLVISQRVVRRFIDLTPEEASDLMASTHTIAKVIEKQYGAQALTITIQDGPFAGQTVPHVHVHIIPRREGDFLNNDDIYPELNLKETEYALKMEVDHPRGVNRDAVVKALKEKVGNGKGPDAEEKPARTQEEMAAEASQLRGLFTHFKDIWNSSL